MKKTFFIAELISVFLFLSSCILAYHGVKGFISLSYFMAVIFTLVIIFITLKRKMAKENLFLAIAACVYKTISLLSILWIFLNLPYVNVMLVANLVFIIGYMIFVGLVKKEARYLALPYLYQQIVGICLFCVL